MQNNKAMYLPHSLLPYFWYLWFPMVKWQLGIAEGDRIDVGRFYSQSGFSMDQRR